MFNEIEDLQIPLSLFESITIELLVAQLMYYVVLSNVGCQAQLNLEEQQGDFKHLKF